MSQIIDGDDIFYSAKSINDLSSENSPNSPYFQAPKMEQNSAVRFTSPIIGSPAANTKNSILEELLPSHVPAQVDNSAKDPAGLSDRIFGFAFKASFAVWFLTTVLLYLYSPRAAALTGLWQVTNWFMIVLALSLFCALALAKVLAVQAETVVYGMTAAIPTGSALLGLYLLGSGWIGMAMAAGLFILAASSGLIFWTRREELQISIGIIRTGAQFLLERPQTFKLTTQLAFAYAFFVLFWLGSFCRLLTTSLFTLKILFVVVLLWTSALFGAAHKFLIAKRVKCWLLDSDSGDEDEAGNVQQIWNSVKERFDSLCVAGAILASTRFARLTAQVFHFTASRIGAGAVSSLFTQISEVIERILVRFTDYVIYYLALRDDSDFWSACGGVGRAVSSHASLSFTVDSISQLLLFFATLSVSFLSVSAVYYLSADQLSLKAASLLGLVSYMALDLIAALFTASIDASFLAYLIIPQCQERASLQSAFSAKLLDA